jgi:hypothetical protein
MRYGPPLHLSPIITDFSSGVAIFENRSKSASKGLDTGRRLELH